MKTLVLVALAAIAILVGVFLGYFVFGGVSLGPGSDPAEWGHFGSYFGGLAGPLLTAGGALFIAYQIMLQRAEIAKADRNAMAREYLHHIDQIAARIAALLARPVSVGSDPQVVFGDVVMEIAPDAAMFHVDRHAVMAASDRLLREAGQYCEAIRLYRDNLGLTSAANKSEFMLRGHVQAADEYLGFLRKHLDWLGSMGGPAIMTAAHLLHEDPDEDED